MPFIPTEREEPTTHTHTHSVVDLLEETQEKLLQGAQLDCSSVLNLSSHPLLWREKTRETREMRERDEPRVKERGSASKE